MNLVWKLLRQHISIPQFLGFFFANLFGMAIVLLGYQFYRDVVPVFTSEDSFMKSDFIILGKKIGAGSTISGRSNTFSAAEIDEVEGQPFIDEVGVFTSSEYKIDAVMSVDGKKVFNSELFFESVPDAFVDAPMADWKWKEGEREVPLILPRSYIMMYNFGFAQSRSLPKISEGLVGMIDFSLFIHGNGKEDNFHGRVIGFSSRLNTILVPQEFMDWSNSYFSNEEKSKPSRVIVKVKDPTDENLGKFIEANGYDIDDDKLNTEKTIYFLKLVVLMVMVVGLVISLLSFYILMLSIYLLVQKNAGKLENLLLIGYSQGQVARPYQWLTLGLNLLVLFIALLLVWVARRYYLGVLTAMFPEYEVSSFLPALLLGVVLLVVVTLLNQLAIRRKIAKIWRHEENF